MKKKKLSHSELEDLATYSLQYPPFWEDIGQKLSIKRFCAELAKEMEYHRQLDTEEGILG